MATQAEGVRQRRHSSTLAEKNVSGGGVHQVSAAELSDHADRALAAEYGYKPVFKREFGYLSTFSFAVSISGLFATVATTFSYPLAAGGPASAVWCWLISGAGCMCIAVRCTRLLEFPALIHCKALRLRDCIRLPYLRWPVLQRLAPGAPQIRRLHLLVCRMAQPSGPDCRRRKLRVWCQCHAARRRVYWLRLHLLP